MQSHLKLILKIILLTCLFVSYDAFIIRSPHSFSESLFVKQFLFNYIISILTLIVWIGAMDVFYKKSFFLKILASILIFIPLGLQTIHYNFYGVPLNAFGIRAFFDEPLIILRLGFENINAVKILVYILFCALVTWIFLYNPYKRNHSGKNYNAITCSIYFVISIPLVIVCGTNRALILDYQNALTSVYAAIPETMNSFYFKKNKSHKTNIVLTPTEKKLPNILWIIGESVVKKRMSIYGYERDTTPGLLDLQKSGALIAFQNAISIGMHTIVSVPYMLVGWQRNDPHGDIHTAPDIFEYAKARNYNTAFISSQDLRWRNLDQLVGNHGGVDFFRTGHNFSSNTNVFKGADDISVLNNAILPYLQKAKSPFLLIAQMDGSHFPYQAHSPQQYKKFLPEESSDFLNAYDNTLVYSDIYLTKLIAAARQKDPNIWIFYTTDHGQVLLHSKGISMSQTFINGLFENAFFVVPPDNMQNLLHSKINAPIAQSDIFATIADLMDIPNPISSIDGISLLKEIPKNRLRLSTSFVEPNKNVPTAHIFYPDGSMVSVNFARKSVMLHKEYHTVAFDDAPKEIQPFLIGSD